MWCLLISNSFWACGGMGGCILAWDGYHNCVNVNKGCFLSAKISLSRLQTGVLDISIRGLTVAIA